MISATYRYLLLNCRIRLDTWKQHGLVILLGGVTIWVLGGFANFDFASPAALGGDHTFMMLNAKMFLNHGAFYNDYNIGFPSEFSHLGFPFSDYTQRVILLIATLITGDVMESINLYYIIAIFLIFVSAYSVIYIYQ